MARARSWTRGTAGGFLVLSSNVSSSSVLEGLGATLVFFFRMSSRDKDPELLIGFRLKGFLGIGLATPFPGGFAHGHPICFYP